MTRGWSTHEEDPGPMNVMNSEGVLHCLIMLVNGAKMMVRTTFRLATAVVVFGIVTSGAAIAQQPAAADAPAMASATHSDPIVQKRMEVRSANQTQRAANAKTRQQANEQQAKARAERNQSVSQSRARATAAMSASAPQ